MALTESEHEIISELNVKHNLDLLEYEKCKELHKNLLQNKCEIEAQLNLSNPNSEFVQILDEARKTIQEAKDLIKCSNETLTDVKTNLIELQSVRQEAQQRCDQLSLLQTSLQYLKVVQAVESFSKNLENEFFNSKDDEHCATLYANLCEISRHLVGFNGKLLRKYLDDVLVYWHDLLKEKLSSDFDQVLKAIKWPFVNANFSIATPLAGNVDKLQLISEYLLEIELPSECEYKKDSLLFDFPQISLPVTLLIKPLRKRFLYHFYGGRQTNRSDKPEWYFTQVLTWIRDHQEFVVKCIQPVIDKLGLHHIDGRLEFICGLVYLCVEKLYQDLPFLQFDDYIFSHSVDEALGFDNELRETFNYPKSHSSILVVLTQAHVFVKWMAMEKKFATEKMDAMLSETNDSFETLPTDIEDLKITTCADAFITLLQTITERYECLSQPGHRLQFLQLQLELLDDFRIRLLQLVNVEETNSNVIETKIPMIANTIYYIENVLIDWSTMLHFLNLFYYKSQLDKIEFSQNLSENDQLMTESVFSDTLSLYKHMRDDLLRHLSDHVTYEIKSKGRNYVNENWSKMTSISDRSKVDFRCLSLTPTACPLFEVLSKCLHQLEKKLARKLFKVVWQTIAKKFDDYLFEDLVLNNRFNGGGALQFKYDVTRNLLPLFSQFTNKPDNYFVQIMEACILLNLSKGSALLLRETLLALEGMTGVEDTRGRALKEIGIYNFTPKMSIKILNQRTDITINRLLVVD